MSSFIFSHLDKFKDIYGFLISCCLKKQSMHSYNITTCYFVYNTENEYINNKIPK
jgi:hypothetical protein